MRPTRVRSSRTMPWPISVAIRSRISARSSVSSWASADVAARTNSVVPASRSGMRARAQRVADDAHVAVEHAELQGAAGAAEAPQHLADRSALRLGRRRASGRCGPRARGPGTNTNAPAGRSPSIAGYRSRIADRNVKTSATLPAMRKNISTENAPEGDRPLRAGGGRVRPGRLVFCSGQIPLDPKTGEMVGAGDVRVQCERVHGKSAARCWRPRARRSRRS